MFRRLITNDGEFEYGNEVMSIEAIMDSLRLEITQDEVIFKAVKDSLVYEALQINETVSPSNTLESNLKLWNEIYLSTVAVDSAYLDSTRREQLYYLANQCPYIGGGAVYAARSLLALVKDTFFVNEFLCDTGTVSGKWEGRAPQTEPLVDSLGLRAILYPNPAKDYAVLKLNKEVAEPLLITITDVVGKKVFSANVRFNSDFYQINTASLSSGLYYVRLHLNTDKIFGGTLSIAR